jgi:hypothetical protein
MRAVWPGPHSARFQAPPSAVAALERRLQWRAAPLLIFVALMAGLAAVAMLSLFAPRSVVRGIPDDPDARAAFRVMRDQQPIGTGSLRFRSELTGESAPKVSQPDPGAVESARRLLTRARERRPLEPRLPGALAHLDLAQRKLARAERGYRIAILLAPHYGEARLGLGVALALRAERETDPLEQRSLRLQAVAQFAAVPAGDPVHAHAIHDRVALLLEVGRRTEAGRHLREYLRGHAGGAWAESLASRLAPAR